MYTPEQIANMVAERAKNEVGYVGDNGVNARVPNKTNKFFKVLDSIKGFYNGKKNGFDWCCGFVDAVQLTVLGEEVMKEITYHTTAGAGVNFAAVQYSNKHRLYDRAKVGDEVFYYKEATRTWQHTGIVVDVTDHSFTTVEGNCSNSVKTFTKEYTVNDGYTHWFGRPNWERAAELINPKDDVLPEVEQYMDTIRKAVDQIGVIVRKALEK